MAFFIQLLWSPELMGIYLVSPKMHCRFMRFGFLLCGETFGSQRGFCIQLWLAASQNYADSCISCFWGISHQWKLYFTVSQAFKRFKRCILFFLLFFFHILHPPLFCHISGRNFPGVFLQICGMLTGQSMSVVLTLSAEYILCKLAQRDKDLTKVQFWVSFISWLFEYSLWVWQFIVNWNWDML